MFEIIIKLFCKVKIIDLLLRDDVRFTHLLQQLVLKSFEIEKDIFNINTNKSQIHRCRARIH
jgi:hypothetical protein